jgi:hypothetical protein
LFAAASANNPTMAWSAPRKYIKRKSFVGIGGDVSTDNNVVMTSVRYYPF